mgnify:FL=1
MKLDTATLAELQAEFVRLGNELSKIDSKRRKILRRIESKKSSAAATARVARLTADERNALRAVLGKAE